MRVKLILSQVNACQTESEVFKKFHSLKRITPILATQMFYRTLQLRKQRQKHYFEKTQKRGSADNGEEDPENTEERKEDGQKVVPRSSKKLQEYRTFQILEEKVLESVEKLPPDQILKLLSAVNNFSAPEEFRKLEDRILSWLERDKNYALFSDEQLVELLKRVAKVYRARPEATIFSFLDLVLKFIQDRLKKLPRSLLVQVIRACRKIGYRERNTYLALNRAMNQRFHILGARDLLELLRLNAQLNVLELQSYETKYLNTLLNTGGDFEGFRVQDFQVVF